MQKTLYAGDTLKDVITSSDYPASDGWQLKARFAPQGTGTPITVDGSSDDGYRYVLTVPASATTGWGEGKWNYTMWVELADDRHTIIVGEIQVLQNPATATQGTDTRSHAKKMLDAIEAVLEKKAGDDVLSYTVKGRSLQHYTHGELIKLRQTYQAEYAREQQTAKGNRIGGRGGKLYVRM